MRFKKILTSIALAGALTLGTAGCEDDITSVNSNISTSVNSNISTGYGQPYVAVGDVTGDGKKDIVYGDKKGVFYLENLGEGKFGKPVKAGETGPLGYGQVPIAVGDVTEDCLEDIIIGNKSGIFVLKNLGNGKFSPL